MSGFCAVELARSAHDVQHTRMNLSRRAHCTDDSEAQGELTDEGQLKMAASHSGGTCADVADMSAEKQHLEERLGGPSMGAIQSRMFSEAALSSGLGGAAGAFLSTAVFYPIELVTTRIQASVGGTDRQRNWL